MKKALYIDCDGTLTTDHLWKSLPEEERLAVQAFLFGGDRKYVNEWMCGAYSSEEVNEYMAKELGIEYEKLWEVFVLDCKDTHINKLLLDRIKELSVNYETILMTGNMDCFSRFTVPSLRLDEYFDHISVSFDEKLHKTDNEGELFKKWEEKLEISIWDSYLLDDQQKVLDIFSNLGGTALLTKGPEDSLKILNSI